jgi:trigger factor
VAKLANALDLGSSGLRPWGFESPLSHQPLLLGKSKLMKVNVEDISTVKKVLHVEIPEGEVTREWDKAYNTLKGTARIKGFRPGKVPRSILERRFGNEIRAQVSGQLIQDSYGEALSEVELRPLGEPLIDPQDVEKGQPYHYSATIEVPPQIADLEVKGLKLKENVHTVTEEEIESQLKILQKRSAKLKTVEEERPCENGDIVVIDYEGFKDGKPFEPAGRTENFQVQIGSGRILEDFDQQLVGMRPDDTKEFPVQFPDDYYNKDLAGLELSFKVELKEIKEEILPELDDQFAQYLGEYQTLDEIKNAINKNLERSYEAHSKRKLREDIVDMLIEQSDFELPEGLVKAELSALIQDARNAMMERGIPLEEADQTDEALSERYQPLAERKVREYLLLQSVIEQEGIALTDEALDRAYEELAEAMGQPVDTIKQFHSKYKDGYDVFRQKTLEKQAIQWITEHAQVQRLEDDKEGSVRVEREASDT